jgi:hypothetical protein
VLLLVCGAIHRCPRGVSLTTRLGALFISCCVLQGGHSPGDILESDLPRGRETNPRTSRLVLEAPSPIGNRVGTLEGCE